MRANTFVGQVIAVLSRRALAFELDSAEPQTFPGRLRALLSRRRRTSTVSPTPTGEQAPEARESFDVGAIRIRAQELKLHSPRVRLRARAYPAFAELVDSLDRNRRDLTLVRDLALDLDRVRDLACDLDLDLGRDRDLERDRVSDRDFVFVLVLGRVLILGAGLTDPGVLTNLDDVLADLDDALHNFTTADLRDVDLSHVQLEGLRWSSATQWPAERVTQVTLDSVEVEPGVFEVRRGGVYARTPV